MEIPNVNERILLSQIEPEAMTECAMYCKEGRIASCLALEELVCKKKFCPFFKRNMNDKSMSVKEQKRYLLGKKLQTQANANNAVGDQSSLFK